MADLSHINSLDALQREQRRLRDRLRQQEVQLKHKMQELPGELAVMGANRFIPKILRGRITNTALSGGKFLINKLFVDNNNTSGLRLLPGIKKPGIFSIVKNVFRMLKK